MQVVFARRRLAVDVTADEWSQSQAVGLGPLRLRPQSPIAAPCCAPTPRPPVTLSASPSDETGPWPPRRLASGF
jgi:hypothetical protein